MKRAILMCAGSGTRWKNHLGTRKHLIRINNERLIDRTVRMLRERSNSQICIAAFDSSYDVPGTTRFAPSHGRENYLDTDKFLCSVDFWSTDDQTLLVYGDVFFTAEAMNAVTSFTGACSFFGRPFPSRCTGRRWAELFALSFSPSGGIKMREAMLDVRLQLQNGQIKRGGGWEVYRRFNNLHPVCLVERRQPVGACFTTIDDFTDDFDHPEDYDEWIARYRVRRQQDRSLWRSSFK